MKAMIFAAGLGTRLKPLTDSCPKALVKVGGKPMLEHVVLKLKKAGFDHLIINIHHLGQQIIDFLQQKENFGLKIDISDERDELLDTGGGIKKAKRLLAGSEPFLIHNVDVASDLDLRAFYEEHCRSGALASLFVGQRDTARYLLFDEWNHLQGWTNCKTGEYKFCTSSPCAESYIRYAFNGIHVMSPEILKRMETWEDRFSIIDFYLSLAANATVLGRYKPETGWIDMGKPEVLVRAAELLKKNEKDR